MHSTVVYAVIGILFVTNCVSSQNLNCTRLTTACPTAAQRLGRAYYFNCSGHKSYVCLIASNAELREGCIFDSMILAGQIGCPYTKQCDERTHQPLLVTENNYLHCPPDLNGCPPRNHSGYSILEIYKYPMCQGKSISDESYVSPKKTTDTVTSIPPARIPGYWIIIVTCIMLGVIIVIVTALLVICRDKLEGGHQQSGDVVKGKSNANSPESNDIFYTKNGIEKSSINSLEEHSKDSPEFNGVIHINDGRSSSQSLERHSTDKDTKDVNFKTRAVNIFSILSKPKKNNTGKKRTELQLPTRQQSYQVKQETSQTSSPDVGIENEHQDNNKGFVRSRDLDAEIVVYNENVDISTTANRETSQRSPSDVTSEAEDQDNIENMIVWKGPRIRSSHASCSSSDSDRSQTPMLKEISKTKRQQPIRHHSNLPLSPQTLPKQVRMDLTCRISDSTTSRLYSDV